jgi:hypothetical protein
MREPLTFDGSTYAPHFDQARLSGQLHAVKELMSDGQWRTLAAIHAVVGGSEAGVSARLRDLRKPRFGGFCIERERIDGVRGLHRYRMGTMYA